MEELKKSMGRYDDQLNSFEFTSNLVTGKCTQRLSDEVIHLVTVTLLRDRVERVRNNNCYYYTGVSTSLK